MKHLWHCLKEGFSRETELTGCVHIYKEIVYRDLTPVTMEDLKSWYLQGEDPGRSLTSLRSKKTNGLVPHQNQRPESQKSWCCCSSPRASRLRKRWCFSSSQRPEMKKCPSPKYIGQEFCYLGAGSIFLFHSTLQLTRWGPPTLWRAIYLVSLQI